MKNTKIFSPSVWLLLGSVAFAQRRVADVPEAPQPQDLGPAKIESVNIKPTSDSKAGSSSNDPLVSQARRYPQLHPGRVRPRGQGYHSHPPMPGLSPWGALIGFG